MLCHKIKKEQIKNNVKCSNLYTVSATSINGDTFCANLDVVDPFTPEGVPH